MDEKRKKVYRELSSNAEELRKVLSSDEFNLALADKLFRERNKLFYQLKDVFKLESADDDELVFVEEMVRDNSEILELVEKKKDAMDREFKKKELDARKITSYLKG